MMKSLLLLAGSILCCTVAFHAWSSRHDPAEQTVKDIVTNPRQFTSTVVAVSGVVGDNVAVLGLGYFQLLGDDGSMLIVLSDQGVPPQGKRVIISGTVDQAYSIGREQMLVLIETPKPTTQRNRLLWKVFSLGSALAKLR